MIIWSALELFNYIVMEEDMIIWSALEVFNYIL